MTGSFYVANVTKILHSQVMYFQKLLFPHKLALAKSKLKFCDVSAALCKSHKFAERSRF